MMWFTESRTDLKFKPKVNNSNCLWKYINERMTNWALSEKTLSAGSQLTEEPRVPLKITSTGSKKIRMFMDLLDHLHCPSDRKANNDETKGHPICIL